MDRLGPLIANPGSIYGRFRSAYLPSLLKFCWLRGKRTSNRADNFVNKLFVLPVLGIGVSSYSLRSYAADDA